MIDKRIIKLGEKIHKALKDLSVNKDYLANEYANGRIHHNLAGGCAVGSHFLVKELRRQYKIRAKFVVTWGHAFVEYNNHIIDITATQFGAKEKVLVVDKSDASVINDPVLHNYYFMRKRLDKKEINTWVNSQQPKSYKLTWLNENKAKFDFVYKEK